MKKLALLVIVCLTLTSCLKEDDVATLDLVPIVQVDGAHEMTLGESLEIQVKLIRPTNCHAFWDFHEEVYTPTVRYIAARTQLVGNNSCELINTEQLVTYYFKPEVEGTHTLRFWNAAYEESEDNYLEYVVEVHQP